MEMNALCGRVFVLQLYLKFLVMSLWSMAFAFVRALSLADRLCVSKGGWSVAIILTSRLPMMSTLNRSHCSLSCQAFTHTIIPTPTSRDERAQTNAEIMPEMFDIFVLHNRAPTLAPNVQSFGRRKARCPAFGWPVRRENSSRVPSTLMPLCCSEKSFLRPISPSPCPILSPYLLSRMWPRKNKRLRGKQEKKSTEKLMRSNLADPRRQENVIAVNSPNATLTNNNNPIYWRGLAGAWERPAWLAF